MIAAKAVLFIKAYHWATYSRCQYIYVEIRSAYGISFKVLTS